MAPSSATEWKLICSVLAMQAWRWTVNHAIGAGECHGRDSAAHAADASRRLPTILLVEDEAFVRDVTCEVLQAAGYAVLKASNAEAALRVYDEYGDKVQLLLTDVVMPGRNGRDLARELRARCPGIKTIFISGYGKNVALLGADHEPDVFYLPKPFSVPALIKNIQGALATP
jgi:two-component system, cell cycle sensor histidine kinase and response regulator CckA